MKLERIMALQHSRGQSSVIKQSERSGVASAASRLQLKRFLEMGRMAARLTYHVLN